MVEHPSEAVCQHVEDQVRLLDGSDYMWCQNCGAVARVDNAPVATAPIESKLLHKISGFRRPKMSRETVVVAESGEEVAKKTRSRRWTEEEIEKVDSLKTLNVFFAYLVEYSELWFPRRIDAGRIPFAMDLGSPTGRVGIAKKFLKDWGPTRALLIVRHYIKSFMPSEWERTARGGYGTLPNMALLAQKVLGGVYATKDSEEKTVERGGSRITDPSGGLVRVGGRWVTKKG